MKKMFQTMWLLGVLVLIAACGDHSRFKYESVPGDPLNARIYTLDNGLKVYMTVNKDQPPDSDLCRRPRRWKERSGRDDRVGPLF